MSFQPGHQLNLSLNNVRLKQVNSHRHLGLIIQADLRWNDHVTAKIAKARQALHSLLRLRGTLNALALKAIYEVYIRPIVEYGSLATSNMTSNLQDKLERLQRRACRIFFFFFFFTSEHFPAKRDTLNRHVKKELTSTTTATTTTTAAKRQLQQSEEYNKRWQVL